MSSKQMTRRKTLLIFCLHDASLAACFVCACSVANKEYSLTVNAQIEELCVNAAMSGTRNFHKYWHQFSVCLLVIFLSPLSSPRFVCFGKTCNYGGDGRNKMCDNLTMLLHMNSLQMQLQSDDVYWFFFSISTSPSVNLVFLIATTAYGTCLSCTRE